MTIHGELVLLMTGIIALLTVASAVGAMLEQRMTLDGSNTVLSDVTARIASWWAMVILLGLAMLAGRIGVLVLFGFVSFAALREFLTLTEKRRADHWALAAAFFVVLPAQYVLVGMNWYGLYSIFIPVYAFLFLPILSVVRGDTDAFLIRVAETQWALMICVFAASHVPALLTLDIAGFEGKSILLIAFLVVTVQLSDAMQALVGTLWGRRRIVPSLSRSKTVEGAIGGVLAAGLAGAGLWWLTPFNPAQAFGMAVVAAVIGYLGRLVMTGIKRDRGVRDWGHLVAGHSGVVDRLDTVIFAAPVFFHVTRYFWAVA